MHKKVLTPFITIICLCISFYGCASNTSANKATTSPQVTEEIKAVINASTEATISPPSSPPTEAESTPTVATEASSHQLIEPESPPTTYTQPYIPETTPEVEIELAPQQTPFG